MISRMLNYSVMILSVALICSNANAGSWSTESSGGFSQVIRYIPDTVSPVGNKRSLLIILHGCMQPISSFKTANLEMVAEEFGMVISMPDAEHKQGFNCWGYWTGTKSRSTGDYKNVINLAKEYMDDPELDIDPKQVYLAGLSSGGAFAMTTWCLAPDIFAGVAAVGAPILGSSSAGGWFPPSPGDTAKKCISYAGKYKDYFNSQQVSIAHGTADTTVNITDAEHNAKALAIVLGTDKNQGKRSIDDMAEEELWFDLSGSNKVSLLKMFGVGHAWPGGAGASGEYIDGTNINYGEYLAEFFKPIIVAPCQVNLNGFEMHGSYIVKQDEGVNLTGLVDVKGSCDFDSITLTINGEQQVIYDSEVDTNLQVIEGENLLQIEAKALWFQGGEVVKSAAKVFDVEYEKEIPSWCNYFPEKYWKWIPSCAVGL